MHNSHSRKHATTLFKLRLLQMTREHVKHCALITQMFANIVAIALAVFGACLLLRM